MERLKKKRSALRSQRRSSTNKPELKERTPLQQRRRLRPLATGNLRANGSKVKLPKLELPGFSGAATEWQPFWEQYQQAIHDNNALSDGEKFLYLHSALSGRAAAAVAYIQATTANYNTVIRLLKERFGRTDVLIQEHLTQLLDLQTASCGHEEDITIFLFGEADSAIKKRRRRVWLRLGSQYDRKEHSLEALEIPEICLDELLVPEKVLNEVKVKVTGLANVTLPPEKLEQNGIGILICTDYYIV
ncbi:hypothetical protein MRX96_034793 [Rhipicephalus microplus]